MSVFSGLRTSISLFAGAGGMDVGFAHAGFRSLLACEVDADACATFNSNLDLVGHSGGHIRPSSILDISVPSGATEVDVVHGGPPCQGFSVAGKMNPDDERSQLVHAFFDVVNTVQPKGFVCENVKALAVSARWEGVRRKIFDRCAQSYRVALVVLNAADFGVPQTRERMFLVGVRKDIYGGTNKSLGAELWQALDLRRTKAPSIAEVIGALGRAGSEANPVTCTAKVVYAKAPILRRSPYAGMLFNGAGRPLRTSGHSTTLPASMGGNKTPIIDEDEVFSGAPGFVKEYHSQLMSGLSPRSGEAPARLRRLTIRECMAIQTFPISYSFSGRKSSVYRQIGNAVPCRLAEAVASSFRSILEQHEGRQVAAAAA